MRSRGAVAALAFGGVLAGLLIAEGVLRVATDPLFPRGAGYSTIEWIVFDPVLAWRNVPGIWFSEESTDDGGTRRVELRINARGFRGPEVATDRPDGAIRIVCLGDSGTFGVKNDPLPTGPRPRWVPIVSYPEKLAGLLHRENQSHVEVVNAGVIGYSSSHGLRQLVVQVLPLEPDIVTVRFGANDVSSSWAPTRRALEPDNPLTRWMLYRFHSWKLVRLSLAAYQALGPFQSDEADLPWTSDERFRRNLERIIELGDAHGFRVLLLDYPLPEPKPSAPPLRAERQRQKRQAVGRLMPLLYEAAARGGVPVVDTREAFAQHPERLFNKTDFVHPNARGAELIAERIFEELLALGWLDPEPAGGH
jgi:lysophospholipase L1-like esterase